MNKKIVLAIGLLILLTGRVFAWWYLRVPEEIIPAEKEIIIEEKDSDKVVLTNKI